MKIIDIDKAFGSPFEIKDSAQARVILLKRFKDKVDNEKVILINNENNPFKMPASKSASDIFDSFWALRKSIIKTKVKNGSAEIFNYDKKIKFIGVVGNNISEINTTDPRFISIWNYNPNIIINLYFKSKNIFKGNLKDFIVLCPDADISGQLFYKMFLLPFPTNVLMERKDLGLKNLWNICTIWTRNVNPLIVLMVI